MKLSPHQIELHRTAAKTLLSHRDAGRSCDPEGIRWAENVLKTYPEPAAPVQTTPEKEQR